MLSNLYLGHLTKLCMFSKRLKLSTSSLKKFLTSNNSIDKLVSTQSFSKWQHDKVILMVNIDRLPFRTGFTITGTGAPSSTILLHDGIVNYVSLEQS